MALVDLIATGKEAEQLITDNQNLQNQLQTAALQHGNDQKLIAELQAHIESDEALLRDDADQISKLQSTVTYPDLEFNAWHETFSLESNVGGSGLGTVSQKSADDKTAVQKYGEFAIVPQAGQYFDCYYTKTFAADDTKKNYRLSVDWVLPSAADVAACRCLEMEIRHIVKGGMMFVIAAQLDYFDKQLRVYEFPAGDTKGRWIPTGVAQARPVPGAVTKVVLEGHRDDTTVFTDKLTVNGVVTNVGKSYPAFNKGWGAAIKTSLQLDGKDLAYTARYKNAKYEVW
jgi:hypothetical protein